MYALTLIYLSLSGIYSDSHSLHYYSTGVSAPGYGLPEFSIVGYVDDQEIESYSSDIGRRVPVAPWIKENERPEYWEERTQISKEREDLFRHEIKLWKKRFNHTEGFHFLQVITYCELNDDGSTISYEQHRYDGRKYMYYDTATGIFIPTMAEAQLTAQKWNALDIETRRRTNNYLENGCIERLKRFIEYGREDLERRVQPGVKVIDRESGEVTKLHCLVYGFYPRAVDVKWMKNGVDDVPSYETTRVLPNPDGTYQIRVTVEVMTKEDKSYSCYVDHSSLGEPLLEKLGGEPTQVSRVAVIISVLVIYIFVYKFIITVSLHMRYKNEEMREAEEPPAI